MKKFKIISITIALALFVAIMLGTCCEWIRQGASVSSLIAAAVFYGASIFALWATFYTTYKEYNEEQNYKSKMYDQQRLKK